MMTFPRKNGNFLLVLVCCFLAGSVHSLHTSGEWSTDHLYTFLAKFAFQKTEIDDVETTRGYIFGNITSLNSKFNSSNDIPPATLVIVDGEYVTDLYGNASRPIQFFGEVSDESHQNLWLAETARCRAMFSRIDGLAWHRKCQPRAKMDFLRSVPCSHGSLCSEEDDQTRVIPGSQFTFTVQDRRQPRYWYLSLIACFRNESTCQWETSALPRPPNLDSESSRSMNNRNISKRHCRFAQDQSRSLCLPTSVKYNIWMVNGVPRLRGYYRFEHEFSFENHDIFEIYVVFGLLYLILAIVFHLKYKGEFEPLAVLLFTHIWLATTAATLQSIHLAIFSFDGAGVPGLRFVGGVVARAAEAIFIILLLTTADVGFPILPAELSHFHRKVRRYRKRQLRRVNSTSNFAQPRNSEDISLTLMPIANTWTASRTKPSDFLNPVWTPSVEEESGVVLIEEEEESLMVICGFQCSLRTRRTVVYLATMIFVCMAIELGLYIWALCDQDPVLDISVWSTTPGRLLVAARLAVSFWFLAILRRSQRVEKGGTYLAKFDGVIEPLHFAAGFLLWFLSSPIIVFIAETSMSPLWRKKTVIGVTYFFDYLASVLFVQLINRSTAYASH